MIKANIESALEENKIIKLEVLAKLFMKGLESFFNPFIKVYQAFYNSYYRRLDKSEHTLVKFLLAVLVLMIVGVMNAYSLHYHVSAATTPFYKTIFIKHTMFLAISIAVGIWIYKKVEYKRWSNDVVLGGLYIATIIGLLLVMAMGPTINGSKRWIVFGPVSVQPSEFAKLVTILIVARWISIRRTAKQKIRMFWMDKPPTFVKRNFPRIKKFPQVAEGMLWTILLGLFVYVQPDFGTAVLVCGFPFLLIILATETIVEIKALMALAALALPIVAIIEPYRLERIQVLLNPWADSQGAGYQITQSIAAVGSGHIWGYNNNITNLFSSGISKYSFLPESHTDFAFAVWAQEHGFFGTMVVIIAVTAIIYYGFCIAQQCRNTFGILTAYGITMMIGLQAIYNLFMVAGFAPVVGVPLPFVSYGGSAMLMNVWGVAIVASIAKDNRHQKAIRQAKKEQENAQQEHRLMRDEVNHRYRSGR